MGSSWQLRSSFHKAEPREWSPTRKILRDMDYKKKKNKRGKTCQKYRKYSWRSHANAFYFTVQSNAITLLLNIIWEPLLNDFRKLLWPWVVFPNFGRERMDSLLTSTDDRNTVPKRDWTQLPNHRSHLTHAQWTCQTGFQYGRHPETPAHSWHHSDALQPRGPG